MWSVNGRTIWSSAGDCAIERPAEAGSPFRLSDHVRAILMLADQARIKEKKGRMICG
jgi:hypothetical protein